jgi:transcriptional regulator, MarR family
MYNFDELGKKIGDIDKRIDMLIAKTGLSYSEFAVLYTLAKDGRSTQKRSAKSGSYPSKQSLTSARIFDKKG